MSERADTVRLPAAPSEGLAGEYFRWHARGQLRVHRCGRCRSWNHPPQPWCTNCGAHEMAWEVTTGKGILYTWAVTHRSFHPGFADDLPLVAAIVQLDEGPRVMSMLRHVNPDGLVPSLPVRAEFEPRADGTTVVVFVPDGVLDGSGDRPARCPT